MQELKELIPISSRDPDGFVLRLGDRIVRAVSIAKAEQVRELLRAPWMMRLMAEQLVPHTFEIVQPIELGAVSREWLWLHHDALTFPCYPHEATALQLYDSALLTLKIASDAAEHGWTLKDASCWNVLYSQGRAVFVDFLSFEKPEFSGRWIAYGQFIRNFLIPLLLYKKLGMTPGEIFLTNRDGITPERAYRMLRKVDLISPAAFELIVLPSWLSASGTRAMTADRSTNRRKIEPVLGRDLFLGLLRRLKKILTGLCPVRSGSASMWEHYENRRDHYSEEDLAAKRHFVRRNTRNCGAVLDLGCNAGEFSLLSAECGNSVVAADFDHDAVSRLYKRIRKETVPITPMVMNIARPTPAIGWQNSEVESFLTRSMGHFQVVLMLGLIHHLIVSERVTLPMLARLLDILRPQKVILEWVEFADPKFEQVAGLNGQLYKDLDCSQLEVCMGTKFRLTEKLRLPCGTRVMYLWTR